MSGLKKNIYYSIPLLFLIGALLHFAFDLLGKSPIVGVIAPVNESVWEHLKLAFYPILAWWALYGIRYGDDKDFSRNRWIISAVISALTAMLIIVAFFYTYTGASGIESLVLDVLSLLIGVAGGQILALHFYEYGNDKSSWALISVLIAGVLVLLFSVWTFNPPEKPIFRDPQTGEYGIIKPSTPTFMIKNN